MDLQGFHDIYLSRIYFIHPWELLFLYVYNVRISEILQSDQISVPVFTKVTKLLKKTNLYIINLLAKFYITGGFFFRVLLSQ